MPHIPKWVLAAMGFAGGVLVSFALSRMFDRDASADASAASTPGQARVLYWFDPMYPDRHFEQPGKSPFMDMQMLPKYADSDGALSSGVRIDPDLVQGLGMRTGVAERGRLVLDVRATAAVAFDERQASAVQARVNGIVERLLVRSPRETVRRGQTLLWLIAPEWTAAQEEYLALRRAASADLDDVRGAARQRLVLLGMSEAQIVALERGGGAQTRIAVSAPRDGVITELAVREGETVMAGATLARINGLDPVWVQASIPESQIAGVAVGADIELSLSAFPARTFNGTIASVLPMIDAASRTQTARIVLDNPEYRLTPGMIGEVRIATAANDAVLVASEAVIVTGKRSLVIVAGDAGAFRAQEVRIGAQAGGRSEVVAGLAAGERVVLSGQFLIDSEASLTGVLTRLGVASVTPAGSAVESASRVERHVAAGRLIDIEGGQWRVDTDAIASLDMGAMRMRFIAPAIGAGVDVAPGQRFEFEFFRNAAGDYEIDGDSIRIAAAARTQLP
jgi:membrane fusion protein, copper/silver efflux system